MLLRLPGARQTSIIRAAAVGVALFAMAIAIGTLWRMREIELEEARHQTATMAQVLADQTTHSLQAMDIVLTGVAAHVRDLLVATDDRIGRLRRQDVHDYLVAQRAQLPQTQTLALAAADGTLVSTSRIQPAPSINVADRDYFRHFRESADDAPFISDPLQDRATGIWSVFIARPVRAADGRLLAVVFAIVRVDYLRSNFSALGLQNDTVFLIVKRDGTSLVRYPNDRPHVGQKLPESSPWYDVMAHGGGVYITRAYFDQRQRIVAAYPLSGYPLVVNVSFAEAEVLADWTYDAVGLGSACAILVGLVAVLMLQNRRQFEQVAASEGSLAKRNAELIEISQQLQTTVANMDQGVMVVDAAGTVVVCNARAGELLNLPTEMLEMRPSYRDLLFYQWRINKTGAAGETFDEFAAGRMDFSKPVSSELRRPDGRTIEVRSVPLAGGGAVRTYTDISDRKAAERESLYFAQHDHLTRLMNRSAFLDQLAEHMIAAESDGSGLALLYLDLDCFKQVNDQLGHPAGDAVLVEAAQRMLAAARHGDLVARIGGDEFTVLLPGVREHSAAVNVAERLIAYLATPFLIQGRPFSIGVSIGIAFFPEQADSAGELIKAADFALYQAKGAGRNTFRIAAPAVETLDARPKRTGTAG